MIWPINYINKVLQGDCLEILKTMPDNSIDSIVTDPPYGLSFMGKHWDYDVPKVEVWVECLRVLKPGGHILCACGTRTQHRMAVNIEDAGFEIRDLIAWIYGSGFPKSLNIGKAVDKIRGNDREITGKKNGTYADIRRDKETGIAELHGGIATQKPRIEVYNTVGTSKWEGWGTALKPAMELWTLARKPLIGTVAANVLQYGTGGINVDGCRVEYASDFDKDAALSGDAFRRKDLSDKGWCRPWMADADKVSKHNAEAKERAQQGRFPANLIHDGSEEVLAGFPVVHGAGYVRGGGLSQNGRSMFCGNHEGNGTRIGDSGSAARFFYCAKASKQDRDEGCEGMEGQTVTSWHFKCNKCGHTYSEQREKSGCHCECPEPTGWTGISRNNHPTVKPTALMRYLCRLVTPPNGIVLDPFIGSGSTGKGAKLEGLNYIGIEREAEYCEIARKRIDATLVNKKLNFKEAT